MQNSDIQSTPRLQGVFAAALTPYRTEQSILLEDIPRLLDFHARRGCHGALLLGTTGEGPSFAAAERKAIFKAALSVRQDHPEFRILAGTGTPSLEETIELTHAAFDLGMDGVVVLPPYFFRKATEDGLFNWFSQVLKRAVPEGGALLGYHIPSVSGVPLTMDLLARLKDAFPNRFAGLKDSSADPEHARKLGQRFGKDLLVFSGNDPLFSLALQHQASGCITALANLMSPDLRRVWDAHQNNEVDSQAQEHLLDGRTLLDRYPPAPPMLKSLLHNVHDFPRWDVRLPLQNLSAEVENRILLEAESIFD